MNANLLKLSKLKIYFSLVLLLGSSFLTLFFSNKTEFNIEDHILRATYLHVENYILIIISTLILIYFIISQIFTFFKEKNKSFLLMFVLNILLLFGLSPFVYGQTFYSDFIGLHIDKFVGLLFFLLSIINLVVLSILFLIIFLAKKKI